MGATKTICYCAGRRCKRIASLTGDELSHLETNLNSYLEEEVCVEGVTAETLPDLPAVRELTQAGVASARRLGASLRAGDATASLTYRQSLAVSSGELFGTIGALAGGATVTDLAIKPIAAIALDSGAVGNDEQAERVLELLAQCIPRAIAELAAASEIRDQGSMQHHSALAMDLVLALLQTSDERNEPSETLLPSDHPHVHASAAREAGSVQAAE